MAIRTLDDLEAALTEDLKWRLHEMEQWEQLAQRARTHEQPGLLRGGIALVYAHWEGNIKVAARSYLEYVSRQGLKLDDLRPELAAIALRPLLGKGEQSKLSVDHTAIVETLRKEGSRPAKLPYGSAMIRTRANLKFDIFADIMHSIGCNTDHHEVYRMTIDGRLLRHRNDIVHGREEYVTLEDWRDIRDRVVIMLKDVRTQISNAAASETFRQANAQLL